MKEYRENKRFRALKEGRIIDPPARTILDCTIRDFGLSGARVQLVSSISIPEHFELLIVREDMIIPARRRWPDPAAGWREAISPADDGRL